MFDWIFEALFMNIPDYFTEDYDLENGFACPEVSVLSQTKQAVHNYFERKKMYITIS